MSREGHWGFDFGQMPVMDGLWLTHFPYWRSEVRRKGRWEVPTPGRWETWTVSSHPALSHGSGGCLCHMPWHTYPSGGKWSFPGRGGGGGWGVGRLSSAWDRMAPPRGCDRNWVWAPPPELQILLLMLEKMFPHYSHSLSLSFSFSHYSHPLIPTLFSDLKGEA